MNLFKHNKKMHDKSSEKIEEIFSVGVRYSGEASKVARQLALGEGATFWFFFKGLESELTPIIAVGLSFLVLYFIFDISQYIVGALLNEFLAETYERLNKKDSPIDPEKISRPITMNKPIDFCYHVKFLMLAAASVLLISLFLNIFIFIY